MGNYNEYGFSDYDARGVRAFIRYADANGGWAIECYRKKTKKELRSDLEQNNIPIDSNWKLIRVGHVQSYRSREEAEIKALELAKSICEEYDF